MTQNPISMVGWLGIAEKNVDGAESHGRGAGGVHV